MLGVNFEELLSRIQEVSSEFEEKCRENKPDCNEREFATKVEKLFEKYAWSVLGVPEAKHEYRVCTKKRSKRGRCGHIDALYGLTFIEYKLPTPGLRDKGVRHDAINQCLHKYIPGLLNDENTQGMIEEIRRKGGEPVITGIIFDGFQVIFITYHVDKEEYSIAGKENPYKLDIDVLREIVERIYEPYRSGLIPQSLLLPFNITSNASLGFTSNRGNRLRNKNEEEHGWFRIPSLDEIYESLDRAYREYQEIERNYQKWVREMERRLQESEKEVQRILTGGFFSFANEHKPRRASRKSKSKRRKA